MESGLRQEFGGAWTIIKLETLDGYLEAWLQVMKRQRFRKIYIDAFAGSGRFKLSSSGQRIQGSADRAIQRHSFDRFYFFDQNPRFVTALNHRAETFGKANKTIARAGDANDLIRHFAPEFAAPTVRGVIFIDPYGMQVNWETLKIVSGTKNLDVWYLFPLAALYRNAPRSADRLDGDKERALDRILGKGEWRSALYSAPKQMGLFGPAVDERTMAPLALQSYVQAQLEKIFAKVAQPRQLLGPNNAPLFSLFFCVSNPNPRAIEPAIRIANHLLTR